MTFHSMAADAYYKLTDKYPSAKPGASLKTFSQGHAVEIFEVMAPAGEQRRFKVQISDGRFSTYNGTLALVPEGMRISEDV